MKPKLLFVIFSVVFIGNAHSQIETDNFQLEFLFTSSYSLSFSENQPFSSLSIGPDLLIVSNDVKNPFLDGLFRISKISLNYQYSFIENSNNLIFGYCIFPYAWRDWETLLFPMILIGINGAYNFDKNIFIVIPEIGINWLMVLSLTYRYNIIIDKDYHNRHEFSIKFKVPLGFILQYF